MPTRPNRHVPKGVKQGREAKRERDQSNDRWRGSAASRGYGHRWQIARTGFLNQHPLCARCETEGRVSPATVVHHKIAHKGDKSLFWDRSNWEAVCQPCHDGPIQAAERASNP